MSKMVELSPLKKNEIAFLNAHPLGPQLTPSQISEYLELNKSTVRTICSEGTNWDADILDRRRVPRRKAQKSKDRQTDDGHLGCTWQLVCALLALFLYICSVFYSSSIRVNKEKWINVCKYDFYDNLHTKLDITKVEAEQLHGIVDDLYSLQNFTELRHEALMATIERQHVLKEKLEEVVRNYSEKHNWRGTLEVEVPEYSKILSIKSFLVKITDLLDEKE